MPPTPTWFSLSVLGVFGLLFGSFANVVIWRLPRGESLSHPASHCPKCGHGIRWYDNIPVVSWLLLRGRCRHCAGPISWRYPAVELLSAGLWLLAGIAFGWSWQTAWAVALFYLLMILAFIDLDLRRLPNPIVLLLAGIGLAGLLFSQVAGLSAMPLVGRTPDGWLSSPLVAGLSGAALGAGLSLLITLVYGLVRGKQGMGMGDVKLLGAIGLFLGPFVVLAFFVAAIMGLVPAFASASHASREPEGSSATQDAGAEVVASDDEAASSKAGPAGAIPFGPFLAAGAVLTAVWGPAVWTWYASMTGIG
jgi:leader peptidase (prepilin peptidase)/N-methyltransferase